jgi:hypothetical protein
MDGQFEEYDHHNNTNDTIVMCCICGLFLFVVIYVIISSRSEFVNVKVKRKNLHAQSDVNQPVEEVLPNQSIKEISTISTASTADENSRINIEPFDALTESRITNANETSNEFWKNIIEWQSKIFDFVCDDTIDTYECIEKLQKLQAVKGNDIWIAFLELNQLILSGQYDQLEQAVDNIKVVDSGLFVAAQQILCIRFYTLIHQKFKDIRNLIAEEFKEKNKSVGIKEKIELCNEIVTRLKKILESHLFSWKTLKNANLTEDGMETLSKKIFKYLQELNASQDLQLFVSQVKHLQNELDLYKKDP